MGMPNNPTLPLQKKQLNALIFDGFRSKSSDIDILDLGCGSGEVTNVVLLKNPFISKLRLNITGLDISNSTVQAYIENTGQNAVVGNVGNLPFLNDSFDIVILDDVIEHLEDTDACIAELHRVLRPHGILLLSTPNLAAWFNRIFLLFGIQPIFSEVSFLNIFGRPGSDVVGHLRLFTPRALKAFLVFHNFKIIKFDFSTFSSLPKFLKPIDRLFCFSKSLGANQVIVCEKL